MPALKRLTVRGFKSIRALEDFELRSLNVLIGANGAGKSNFLSLFDMLAALMESQLQRYVMEHDGPNALLFGSRKRTAQLDVELYFEGVGYRISLTPTGERLLFVRDETWQPDKMAGPVRGETGAHYEQFENAEKVAWTFDPAFAHYVRPAIAGWRVFHFHDTSVQASVRQAQQIRDNLRLKADGGNLAPYLRHLHERHPEHLRLIEDTVRLVAPFFGGFVYRFDAQDRVELEWFHRDDPDTPYGPRQLSDGTLRFIAITTLLLQPTELQPDLILLDEPELGLHPYALSILSGLLQRASEQRQIIVSTQSAHLVSNLSLEDIVVVNRVDGASTFERRDPEEFRQWLEDYSLGELWEMNVLGGRP